MSDRLARILAACALALSLIGVVLGGYALHLNRQYRDDVRILGETLRALVRPGGVTPERLPLRNPPPVLDPDDR